VVAGSRAVDMLFMAENPAGAANSSLFINKLTITNFEKL
jgi:hypothetical protein